ncbi:MAG: hypothetical protein IJ422_06425 [Oscillospiraceae bacterium]|nr:hypothetical protein [Oscillospiraceae bacterium]
MLIDYKVRQDSETIHKYLSAYERYNTRGLFGFTLPRPVFIILSRQAAAAGCTCSELLQQLLEQSYAQEPAAVRYQEAEAVSNNLFSAECYGDRPMIVKGNASVSYHTLEVKFRYTVLEMEGVLDAQSVLVLLCVSLAAGFVIQGTILTKKIHKLEEERL